MTWIQTFTGRAFDLAHPDPDAVDLTDIAWSLSRQCRFNGHTGTFYSVAEHSVHVAVLAGRLGPQRHPDLSPEAHRGLQRAALLHDAAEAYIGDIVQPLKVLLASERLAEIEADILDCIGQCFGIHTPHFAHPLVKHCDLVALATERAGLLFPCDREWGPLPEPDPYMQIWLGLDPDEAHARFLAAARHLGL